MANYQINTLGKQQLQQQQQQQKQTQQQQVNALAQLVASAMSNDLAAAAAAAVAATAKRPMTAPRRLVALPSEYAPPGPPQAEYEYDEDEEEDEEDNGDDDDHANGDDDDGGDNGDEGEEDDDDYDEDDEANMKLLNSYYATSANSGDSASNNTNTNTNSSNNNNNNNNNFSDIIQVNCNSIVGDLHKRRLGSGGKGKCIRVLVSSSSATAATANAGDQTANGGNGNDSAGSGKVERWFTPIEFETFCGKAHCRDWKRTIRVGGQKLVHLFKSKVLVCHAVSCACTVCNDNDSLVGPIRPFQHHRRRNKEEIAAHNAYKKLLNLKPPTLVLNAATLLPPNNNNNNNNNNNMSTNATTTTTSANDAITYDQQQPQHLGDEQFNPDSTSSNKNTNDESMVSNSTSSFHQHSNEEWSADFYRLERGEEEQWNNLEQIANNLMNEARNLKTLVDKARRESHMNRLKLVQCILFSKSNTNSQQQPTIVVADNSASPLSGNGSMQHKRSRDESAHLTYLNNNNTINEPRKSNAPLSNPASTPMTTMTTLTTGVHASKKRKTKSTSEHQANY